ncbi:hypothetical protein ACJMK2_033012 [Sinanodonta woodiana]|uniref:Glutaredoxin domain-containing protein n=1 Tax=Sinanodonta woodiana TaxID=1069815 RepID=A0ABD3X3I8_SINWO
MGGCRNFRELEKGKVIVYTTTMTVVRETADRCNVIRKILQNHMIRYEERDLFMSKENQKELMERLGQNEIGVPQVFLDGIHVGGVEAIEALNESGELRERLQKFSKVMVRSSCDKCGGYRFMPCLVCHGSKKSVHRNDFTEEFCALRCMQCDENGLMRCDMCLDQQE